MSCVGLCSCVYYTLCHVLVCVVVSLILCVKCVSVFLCLYTLCHVLVCVLVSLTLCVKCISVFLCLLHYMSCVGMCSCVSNTVCQV